MVEQENPKNRRLTSLGYIFFICLVTLTTYAIINFFWGGIPWFIVLCAVILGFVTYAIKN